MAEIVCTACRLWLCSDDDAYCGLCGQPCSNISLRAVPSVFMVGHNPPEVIFKLVNCTCAIVHLNHSPLPPWLSWTVSPAGKILAPGETVRLTASASTESLTEPTSSDVAIETSAGAPSVSLLVISETPAFAVKPAEAEIWLPERGTSRVSIELRTAAGALRILSVRTTGQPWLNVLTQFNGQFALVSPTKPLKVEFELLPAKLPIPFRTFSCNEVALDVRYEGIHGEAAAPVVVKFATRVRPALTWTGERDDPPKFKQMPKRRLAFNLANFAAPDRYQGNRNALLVVSEATLLPPRGMTCTIRRTTPLPLEILGGKSKLLEFEADFEAFPADLHHFTLKLRSNGPDNDKTHLVPVKIDHLEPFTGTIAIDFGSSNSCCILLEESGDFKEVMLDGQAVTCPTVLSYLDLSQATPQTATGILIQQQAAEDDRVAASRADHLKQQLGDEAAQFSVRPKNSDKWLQRDVTKAAADYLRHIRDVAQQTREVVFKKFILTHPAICSLKQYQNLRIALKDAFGEGVTIDFLSEPVAALMPFIRKIASDPKRPGSYMVAAFDVGGGTTDVTVVRVEHRSTNTGEVEIQPIIVTSWGERFGGEDLSAFLIEELKSRCQKIIAGENSGYELADRKAKGFDTPNARLTHAALEKAANDLKKSWSEEANSEPWEKFSDFVYLVSNDPNQPEDPRKFTVSELNAGNADLKSIFMTHLRSRIERLSKRLKESVGSQHLDYIQLSGKTTFLPLVRDILQGDFKAQIVRAGDPKECVVRGACVWLLLSRGRELHLLPSNSQRTTSSIGLLDEGSQRFQPMIGFDQAIPKEGLQPPDSPNFWNGKDYLILWENLGFEDRRLRDDDSINHALQKLGAWSLPAREFPEGTSFGIRLRLHVDFDLDVIAIAPNGELIPLKPRESHAKESS